MELERNAAGQRRRPGRGAEGAAGRDRARQGSLHLREDGANRSVLQLVGRHFSIQADRPWGNEQPASQLVVIGLPGTVDENELDATLARLTASGA